MNFISHRLSLVIITAGILLLFLFMRLYRLPQTLEFYSDIGRDHYMLLLWQQSGKPPLLGPSTSFLPLNQSPWYFYLMYPVFLILGLSPYTSIITLLLFYCFVYLLGVYVYRNNPIALRMIWIIFTVISIHSLFVEQNRYPWNPSFVTPFLLISLFALFFNEGGVKRRIVAFTAGTVFALGMSYSIVPTALVLTVAGLIHFKRNWLLLCGSLVFSGCIVFLPILVSEMKHGFFSFHRLFSERGGQFSFRQDLWLKMKEMFLFVFWGRAGDVRQLLWPLAILTITCLSLKLKKIRSDRDRIYAKLLLLLIATVLLTLISPFVLYSHYVYGVLTLLICLIATFPKRLLFLFILSCLPFWFSKDSMNSTLLRPIRRSVSDLETCAVLVCASEKEPMYIVDAAWHDYHFAPDHLFFFNRAGCNAKDITSNPGFANRMAVVIDQGSFTFGKSSFNELTLFGEATPSATYQCPSRITVEVLKSL
ncbi:MAG: hypothetical protein ABI758_03375 [Candidatus Woesebacteria bacterium]